MTSEQIIDQLFETLLSLQNVFARQMQLLNDSIATARMQYLTQLFERKRNDFADCLAAIDRQVLECSARIEEYERLRSNLHDLRQRLFELTGEPVAEPEAIPTKPIEDLVRLRVDYLKSLGKL